MLKLMMETRGRFSVKMLKKCAHYHKYFDSEFNFLYSYYDKNTKENTVKNLQIANTHVRELIGLIRRERRVQ